MQEGLSDSSNLEVPNPYLETTAFMETLATLHPKHSLDHHVKVFEDNGYLHIDEIKGLQEQVLMSKCYSFLPGTAQFLLAEVNKWVCAVDKAAWRAKKARRSEM